MENDQLTQSISSAVANAGEMLGGLSGWVTALATVVLAVFTLALFIATLKMARAMARPHVIANIESNQWSMMHMDLVVENCGNAPAYDVKIKIDPPIALSSVKGDVPLPYSNISIIRPGQSLVSFATEYNEIKDKVFHVEITWRSHPKASRMETLSYDLNMRSLDGVSHLGKLNPMIQVAEEVKKLRDDWRPVSQGQRRTKVDVYDQGDRDEARRLHEERLAELRERDTS